MKILIFIFVLIILSFSMVIDGKYLILFLLVISLAFYLLKKYENYDPRIELSEDLYNKLKDYQSYYRFMTCSGCYDDDLDSDETYKNWEKRIKLIEKDLPKYLKDEMEDFPVREFECRYKIKD